MDTTTDHFTPLAQRVRGNKEVLSGLSKDGLNFMAISWYNNYIPWFCFYYKAIQQQGITTFGFDKWKKALENFKSHEKCNSHREAEMKWAMIHKYINISQLTSN